MINIINTWTQRIVVVVIICTIIEMILPEGKNKKYVKTIIGIYVIFTIISPIISKLNNKNLNLEKYINIKNNDNLSIETSASIDTNKYIEETYKENLKKDIQQKVQAINYNAQDIKLEIETKNEENYGQILVMELSIENKKEELQKQNTIQIENVVIGESISTAISPSNISQTEKDKIKQYLAEIYYINSNKIIIR